MWTDEQWEQHLAQGVSAMIDKRRAPDPDWKTDCPECSGDGFRDCPDCGGAGDDDCACSALGGVTCFYCQGTGRVVWGRRRIWEVWIHHFLERFEPDPQRPGSLLVSFDERGHDTQAMAVLLDQLGNWQGYGPKTIISSWYGPAEDPEDRTSEDYCIAQRAPEGWEAPQFSEAIPCADSR
jgi:hypothetical protein